MSQLGTNSTLVRVYTPDSPLERPADLFRQMAGDVVVARELAWRLFLRNLTSQHRRTLLGYVWALLPPLATTAIWVFLNAQNIVHFELPGVSYPAFVLTGILLWRTFIEALEMPQNVINGSRDMLTRVNFPRESLLLLGMLQLFFEFGIKTLLLAGVFVWLQVLPPATMLLAPLGVLAIIGVGLTIGLILLPISMLSQDFGRAMGLVTSFWFYVTPIIYPPPQNFPANLINWLNPISPPILATRDWLLTGSAANVPAMLVVCAIAAPLFILGLVLYRLMMPILIERT